MINGTSVDDILLKATVSQAPEIRIALSDGYTAVVGPLDRKLDSYMSKRAYNLMDGKPAAPTNRKRKLPERFVVGEIVRYLKSIDWEVFVTHGSGYTMQGLPDIVAIGPDGRVVWIECKGPDGKIRAKQALWFMKLLDKNHQVVVARSVADVREAIVTGASSEEGIACAGLIRYQQSTVGVEPEMENEGPECE